MAKAYQLASPLSLLAFNFSLVATDPLLQFGFCGTTVRKRLQSLAPDSFYSQADRGGQPSLANLRPVKSRKYTFRIACCPGNAIDERVGFLYIV
jgi:hypothetical protein